MERSYNDRADSATNFDPEMQFDKDIESKIMCMSKTILELARRLDNQAEVLAKTAMNSRDTRFIKLLEDSAAALRASAVAEPVATSNADICPQCGLNRNSPFPCEHTHPAPAVANVRLEARPVDGSQEWTEIFPSQLQWVAKAGHEVRAIDRTYKPGDVLSYEMDEATRVGRITSHVRPAAAPTREEIIEQCLTAARSGFEKAMEQYILIGPSGMAMMMINSIRALKEDKC